MVVKKVLAGENITAVARAFMVSRTFVYRWKKRYEEDPEGLWWEDRSSRPHVIHYAVTDRHRQRILELRNEYAMNVEKIAFLLQQEELKLSKKTIIRVLKEEEEALWRTTKKTYTKVKRFERPEPNDLWQLDMKGPIWVPKQGQHGQHLHLVTLIDDYSRFILAAHVRPRPWRQEELIQLIRTTALLYGSPRQVLTDNGAQFHAMRGGTSTFT